MSQELIWLSTQETVTRQLIGGKGHGLLQLTKLGLPVPAGFILTTEFFATALTGPKEQLILAAYELLGQQLNKTDPAVAVRSSATHEDGQQHSFAGAHDTFLWIEGTKSLLEKIKMCRDSLFSERAAAYRREMSKPTAVPQMAVIVQAMIPAQASGVLMTLNPSNGDRSKIIIESTWGLGQLLVDGAINPDRFLVDKVTDELIDQTIAVKTKAAHANNTSGSGISIAKIPSHLQNTPSLTEEEIHSLCQYGRLLETHFTAPQDVEFATYQKKIFILQVRPETVWAQKQSTVYGLKNRPIDHIVKHLINFGKTQP